MTLSKAAGTRFDATAGSRLDATTGSRFDAAATSKTLKSTTNVNMNAHTLESMFRSSQMNATGISLNENKLRSFLKRFKVFPDRHRPLIWKYLLGLPCNGEA